MKYEKLIFIYPFSIGSFLNAKIGLEATLEEGDDVDECYRRLSEDVKALADKERGYIYDVPVKNSIESDIYQYFDAKDNKVKSSPTPVSATLTIRPEEDRRVGDLAKDIRSCTELRVLETYRFLIKNKPEFQSVYDEMHEKLTNAKQSTINSNSNNKDSAGDNSVVAKTKSKK